MGYIVLGAGIQYLAYIECTNGMRQAVFSIISAFPTNQNQAIFWKEVGHYCLGQSPTGQTIRLRVRAEVQFVKIGNASQHATLPQNFTTVLFGTFYYNQNAPTTPVVSPTISWTMTGFVSRVITRTCTTPAASESTLYLGTFNQQEIQALPPGTTTPPQGFTLTFTCPYAAYDSISFFVEPMHGEISGYGDGVMGISQGDGMAKGVGIYLEEYGLRQANTYLPVIYRTDSLPNIGFGAGVGKYPLANFMHGSVDPLPEPPRQQVVQFRASLIRLNEPVVAGQVKAAALIHIRYN